jgi:hypothetical protein
MKIISIDAVNKMGYFVTMKEKTVPTYLTRKSKPTFL